MEMTFTLRKNGGHRTSSLGSRSFPVVYIGHLFVISCGQITIFLGGKTGSGKLCILLVNICRELLDFGNC